MSDKIWRNLTQCRRMETLSWIRGYDFIGLSYIQRATYSRVRRRKVAWSSNPMDSKTQTRKIFQYRRIHQSRIFCSTYGIRSIYPFQRSHSFPRHKDPIFRIKNGIYFFTQLSIIFLYSLALRSYPGRFSSKVLTPSFLRLR